MSRNLVEPVILMRRKKVQSHYNPNTYRVINDKAVNYQRPECKPLPPEGDLNTLGQKLLPSLSGIKDYHKNRPNPRHLDVITSDSRILNAPVCTVNPKGVEEKWWVSPKEGATPVKPAYSFDSTVRDDFRYRGEQTQRNTRHSSNPNKEPALGVVPVNSMWQRNKRPRFWQEGLSYEHAYNCRLEKNYPNRGRRQGAFVHDLIPDGQVDKMLCEHGLKLEGAGQSAHPPWQLQNDPSALEFMSKVEKPPPPPELQEHVPQQDEVVVRPPHLGAPGPSLPPIS